MPDIELRDLNRSIGTELFSDTESFLEDLTDDANIFGGSVLKNDATIIVAQTTSEGTTIHDRTTTGYMTSHYRPYPGQHERINYTAVITTTVYKPHRPPHPRPIHPTFVTGDI